jgi:hypothetical protein
MSVSGPPPLTPNIILKDQTGKEVIRTDGPPFQWPKLSATEEELVRLALAELRELERPLTPTPQDFHIPRVGYSTIDVIGPFDVERNTSVRIGGVERPILLEVEKGRTGRLFFESRNDIVGLTDIEMREGDVVVKGKYNQLRVEITATERKILRGKTSLVTTRVEGFKGLEPEAYPVSFEEVNHTPQIISFEGVAGPLISHSISREEVGEGVYARQVTARGLQAGEFSISASVFQEPRATPLSDQASRPTSATEDQKKIDRLIQQLGADDIQERDDAQQELAKIGAPAIPSLEKALTDQDLERRTNAAAVLRRILGTIPSQSPTSQPSPAPIPISTFPTGCKCKEVKPEADIKVKNVEYIPAWEDANNKNLNGKPAIKLTLTVPAATITLEGTAGDKFTVTSVLSSYITGVNAWGWLVGANLQSDKIEIDKKEVTCLINGKFETKDVTLVIIGPNANTINTEESEGDWKKRDPKGKTAKKKWYQLPITLSFDCPPNSIVYVVKINGKDEKGKDVPPSVDKKKL